MMHGQKNIKVSYKYFFQHANTTSLWRTLQRYSVKRVLLVSDFVLVKLEIQNFYENPSTSKPRPSTQTDELPRQSQHSRLKPAAVCEYTTCLTVIKHCILPTPFIYVFPIIHISQRGYFEIWCSHRIIVADWSPPDDGPIRPEICKS